MTAVRDIITHVEVEVALGGRICHRNRKKHSVLKGEKCLIIRDSSGGKKNYCLSCAGEIIEKAKAKLLLMQQALQQE